MTARYDGKGVHFCRISEGVNRNNCSGFVRDRRFSLLWTHVESYGINVDKDGICSYIANRVGDSDEGERRHKHVVPRLYTESEHAKVGACSSGADADGMGRTRVNGNGLLEFSSFGSRLKRLPRKTSRAASISAEDMSGAERGIFIGINQGSLFASAADLRLGARKSISLQSSRPHVRPHRDSSFLPEKI